ncbi:unnamed protein product [Closterium sp. Yama58-4]|nr:unnamed protein product [Closterium sp. Yama58-4]
MATASVTYSKSTGCSRIERHCSTVVPAPAVINSSSNAQPTERFLYSSSLFLSNSSAEHHWQSSPSLLLLQSQRRQPIDIALRTTRVPHSLAFAALHACYCIVIGLKEKVLPPDFLRTAAGLSSLLIASALRLNSTRYGFDSYVLGLGASVGVSVWSAERCFLRKEASPSGVAALCSAIMAALYTCALYHTI